MKNWKCAVDKLVTVADLQQYFLGAVILFKEKPTKVMNISASKVFKMLDLETGKTSTEADPFGHITPPNRRIGMVNFRGDVFYIKRVPQRQYSFGFTNANIAVNSIPGMRYIDRSNHRAQLQRLECRELADAMFNKYPSLKECIEHNEEFHGTMAFDKQFAIDADRKIYFKELLVGTLPGKYVSAGKIQFATGYEYLSLLLDRNYEKDLRTTAPSCGGTS